MVTSIDETARMIAFPHPWPHRLEDDIKLVIHRRLLSFQIVEAPSTLMIPACPLSMARIPIAFQTRSSTTVQTNEVATPPGNGDEVFGRI